jgi:hypothetical protein
MRPQAAPSLESAVAAAVQPRLSPRSERVFAVSPRLQMANQIFHCISTARRGTALRLS